MNNFFRKFLIGWSEKVIVYGFLAFVFLFLVCDRLLWMSGVGKINLNGWIGFFHSLMPLFFLVISPLFLLGSCAKCFYIPFFFVEFVLLLMGWFARINFKMVLDGDWVGIVLGSSPDEMIWFLKHYSLALLLSLLFSVGFLLGVWKLTVWACNKSRVTKATVAMGVGGILLFFYANQVLASVVYKKYENLGKQIYGVNLVIDSFRHWDEMNLLAKMKTNSQIPSTIMLSEDMADDVIGVIILGESATRNHWGLYGYERDTTPCMNARKNELMIFEDLVTPVGGTAESMRYAFTTRTIEEKSDLRFTMAQCLRSVGYDVAMFSNQERWGEWDGEETFDFAGCDPFLFMKEQAGTNAYDEVLLPYFTNFLATAKRKSIVFLHLRGSHVPASSGYPKEGVPFDPEEFAHSKDEGNPALTKNHYDNSIWYTDKVLERVICELESKHVPAWMIYFSDHGETPSSKSWRTQTDNDLWEIPFIIWTSREFGERFPEKINALKSATKFALQSDQLLYGVLSFCGIYGLGNDASEDFLDPSFKCREVRLVQGGRVRYEPTKAKTR